ncbi:MAG: putative selenate reductase subunit YgfK [Oligoflexia bacterium]|nr:putative selenate reductase subunit YgfK [Oligoflexia bacterium]
MSGMSGDRMYPLSIQALYQLINRELEIHGSIFGISKALFFSPKKFPKLAMKRYGQLLETPLGVAAGPHTQLAQNIIAAWLVGARYIELKTVQTLDELEVSKPCIDAEDEGFNCEWSQELKLQQSFQEYLKAWILIHWLQERLKFKSKTKGSGVGTIFNMSVGYNLEGILKENVQTFLKKMRSCESDLAEAIQSLSEVCPEIKKIRIPAKLTDNITLSTMHGCPPDEIEKIAMYLLEEQGLHTTIKLNPTLNGEKDARGILQKLGFENVTIPDIAFEHDLKYADGVKMLRRLKKRAQELKLDFGVKLTNTLEVVNNKNVFDPKNEMMYMSGRALHALSINLAHKLQKEFKGELDVSFSAGVDAFNVSDVLACNLRPITVCTELLKPGGYGRLLQYCEQLTGTRKLSFKKTTSVMTNLQSYRDQLLKEKRLQKDYYIGNNIKLERELSDFDCIVAPCSHQCPAHQPVPEYMYLTAKGDYKRALTMIRESNPFPNSTGMACDHICENKCTRLNYDEPLQIREIKRFLASTEKKIASASAVKKRVNKRVCVVGAGPSGLSAAYYLAYLGFSVEVLEKKSAVGGMLTHALPPFRTIKERVAHDIDRILAMGVTIKENTAIENEKQFEELRAKYDYLYLAVGAPRGRKLNIPGESEGIASGEVLEFLNFLEELKWGRLKKLPAKIVVIGGGNSAIDAVRSAKRLVPKSGGKVTLLYRRTKSEMPANKEEILELEEEKIDIMELVSPVEVVINSKSGRVSGLKCVRMELSGEKDKSGRAIPKAIEGSEFVIAVNAIINATGQEAVLPFWPSDMQTERSGAMKVGALTGETNLKNVFAGGDFSRGPASIIKAIADGQRAAREIAHREGCSWPFSTAGSRGKAEVNTHGVLEKNLSLEKIRERRAKKLFPAPIPKIPLSKRKGFDVVIKTMSEKAAKSEALRCLYCDELCEVCVTVCPNRANISYQITKGQKIPCAYSLRDLVIKDGAVEVGEQRSLIFEQAYQVANIGEFCNECGNCATFCPSSGRPYLDKPKIYLTQKAYEDIKEFAKHNTSFYHSCLCHFRSEEDAYVGYYWTPEGEFKITLPKSSGKKRHDYFYLSDALEERFKIRLCPESFNLLSSEKIDPALSINIPIIHVVKILVLLNGVSDWLTL